MQRVNDEGTRPRDWSGIASDHILLTQADRTERHQHTRSSMKSWLPLPLIGVMIITLSSGSLGWECCGVPVHWAIKIVKAC